MDKTATEEIESDNGYDPDYGLTDNELIQIQIVLDAMDNLNLDQRYRAIRYVVARKLPKHQLI